jgi:hypothetical protein
MSDPLKAAVEAIEALFDEVREDKGVQGVTIVWSGGLDNKPEIPPILCETQEFAVEHWQKTLTHWAGKNIGQGNTLVWRVRPEMHRWMITMQNRAHLERLAADRFAVYSVLAIVPTQPKDEG